MKQQQFEPLNKPIVTISFDNFKCIRCRSICLEPILTGCCQQIICQKKCYNQKDECPKCKSITFPKFSKFLKRIYQNSQITCPNSCGTKTILSNLQEHFNLCENHMITCKFCKEAIIKKNLFQHLKKKHQEQFFRLMVQHNNKKIDQKLGQTQIQNRKRSKAKPVIVEPLIKYSSPFKHIKKDGTRICIYGRTTCGKNIQKLQSNRASLSLFSSSKKNIDCSADNGSCDNCMAKDVDRLELPKGYFLNMSGRICIFLKDIGVVACGLKTQPCYIEEIPSKICSETQQCKSCLRIAELISKGCYFSLI